jgi:ABC-type transport system involved in Fe-S cluster assembly fused permease/ATPase subunit
MNSETSSPTESTSLLNGGAPNGNANGNPFSEAVEAQKDAWSRPDKMPTKSWWEYIRGYSLFFPYLWPAKSVRLQVTVVICFVIVMLLRLLNVLVPIQVGVITNELSGADGQEPRIPWLAISLYILYRTLQGSNGVLGALRSYLWIPISQYSYQELSTASFEHVHGLSLDFHLGKKTGEVLSALGKGQSINTFLEQVTFQMLPMLIDLAVAIGYFFIIFDEYYAMVIAIVSVTYLYVTIRLAAWRVQVRRDMVNADRQEDAVKNDSMVSYETVKYFNAEQYEFNRYRNAVQDYQKAEYKVLTSLNIMNVSQNLIFTLGLFITCFICAYQVTIGVRKVGDFVTLLIYMAQLQAPLNFFGTFYRSIQTAMINAERLLELFKEKPSVIDSPFARPLPSCEGEIRYSDVHFAYDPRKPALNGVTFTCAPGTTTALVGETGGGKSTIFRLLFRFYNATSGSIQIDGHDVDNITIDSLRRLIGVVPQDTVLFNESLMYNLKYANPSATDEDVYAACRAASIHDKIMAFPDGYNARVGERGLKLSGGEKQRVAIARTIIKDPRIILLDEATAALDSETEQHIQEALDQLSQGRTTLVIAHRLSTITMADQILVLQGGKISEAGSHDELLAKKGKYASMWRKQIRAQKAAEEAKVLSDRAEQLRSGSLIDESADHSEDERSGGSGKKSRPLSQSGLRTPLLELDSMNFTTVPNTIITRPS